MPLFASTNWGAESWEFIKTRYTFLTWFDGALVSGRVGMAKPDPAFFEMLTVTFGLVPDRTIYIEDNAVNLEAAAKLGFVTHLFVSPEALRAELDGHGLLDVRRP